MLANLITLGRLVSVPVAVWLILDGKVAAAFWLFVAAAASDALDGLVARLFDARSRLGALLDPLADKVLLVSVFLTLSHAGLLPLWLVVMVVSRDVMIVGGVALLAVGGDRVTVRPFVISKVNTVAQSVLAALVLGLTAFAPGRGDGVLTALTWLVAATTVLSGAAYLYTGCRLMNRPEARP